MYSRVKEKSRSKNETAAPVTERLRYALTGIRTPVSALKGPRPGPLDDEGNGGNFSTGGAEGQYLV